LGIRPSESSSGQRPRNVRPGLIAAGVLLTLAAMAAILPRVGHARVKGSDRSLTILAGSTGISGGTGYPVLQRPPLYSAFLALLGGAAGTPPSPTVDAAREFGNIRRLPVAKAYLKPSFLRVVLIGQTILFLGTIALVVASLRVAGCSPRLRTFAAVLLLAIPNTWLGVGEVWDSSLTQFLLAASVAALSFVVSRRAGILSVVVAGTCLSLAGLSHATFQLLAPTVAVGLLLLSRFRGDTKGFLRAAAVIAGIWILLVGGWSVRNLRCCGFVGVSAVAGSTLGTRTATYLEEALPAYPEEVSMFLRLRQETIAASPEHSGLLWAGPAVRWLMETRGLDYVQANALLLRVNLAAIRRAPLNYLLTVSESVVSFLWTITTASLGPLRPLFAAADLSLLALFLGVTALWLSYHFLPRLTGESPRRFEAMDGLIVLLLIVFWYAAAVFCGVDVGKPQQRASVQFVMPALVALGLSRLSGRTAHGGAGPAPSHDGGTEGTVSRPAAPSRAAPRAAGPPWPPG